MYRNIVAWFQQGFESLVYAKERLLGNIFSLPVLRQVFEYITPNQLCYFRIFAALVVMWAFVTEQYTLAFTLFVFAAVTDFIDGPLARFKHQVSDEGKNLDPVADKVLITIPLLLIGSTYFSAQAVTFFLIVELVLLFVANALKPYLRSKFDIPLSSGSNAFGQIKMTIQTVTVGLLLLDPLNSRFVNLSETMLWISIAFALMSFLRHLARFDAPLEDRKKRIITLPNLITLTALFLCVPAGFALARSQFTLALLLLIGIFLSDWIDGILARKFNQETHFGAVIDPIRDYVVRFLALVWFLLRIDNGMVTFIGLVAASIEIVVALVNLETATRCKTLRLVNKWGKLRGLVQYTVFAIILATFVPLYSLSIVAVQILFGIAAFASLLSLLSYVDQRRQLLHRQNQTAGQD